MSTDWAEDSDSVECLYPGYVYVLKLQDECLYVGYTANPEIRLATHFLGRGAQWTVLHKPVGIKNIQPGNLAHMINPKNAHTGHCKLLASSQRARACC